MREFGGEALGIDLAVRHHGDVAPRRPRHPHPGENPRTVTDARHLETRYFPLDLGLLERAGHGGEEESGGGHDHDVGEVTRDAGEYQERSEEHTSELQSRGHLVCRLLLEKKKTKIVET